MKFRKLVEYLEELERTASRLEMTRILAEVFRQASEEEIDKICYLSLGRLVPLYESLEFNLAEKMVMRAMAEAFGVNIKMVVREFKQEGDLGKVAEKLRSKGEGKNLAVLAVYDRLRGIAEDGGQGSQERKVSEVTELLRGVEAVSGKYIVKMILGKLRLGFSDKTIIDALSWMVKGDKSLREELEQVYFVRADIGALAKVVKKYGKVRSLEPELGVPVMPALCQRLKSATEMITKMGKVAVEPKFDGVRCISGSTGLLIKNRGYISVREVRVGNEVLTHTGKFCRITGKTYRWKKRGEKVFRFQTYLGDEFRVSEGHRLLVQHGGGLRWLPVDKIHEQWVYFPKPLITDQPVPLQNEFIDKAGYSKTVMFNTDFFRFLGHWVGDGISNTSHQMERVGLVFNRDNASLMQTYEKIIRGVLHISYVSRDERKGAVVLYWRDPIFRKWLCEHFRGEHESGKRIPAWFFGLDTKRFLAFLQGWQEADGTPRSGGGNRIVTKERQLALMAQLLSFKHNMPIGIRRVRLKPSQLTVTKTYYELATAGTDRYVRPFENGYLVKIRRLEPYKMSGRLRLYDIQVEGDKSFCVSAATLHNCQIHIQGKDFLRTFTRNLENSTEMFPELKLAYKQVDAHEVILDSEAVGIDPKNGRLLSFQDTMVRKRKHGVEETSRRVPLQFFVFDVLYKDGKSLLGLPLSERRKILEAVLDKGRALQLTEQVVTDEAGELRKYHSQQLSKGLEGVVVKKWAGRYAPGRREFNWVKFKEEEKTTGGLADTLDCVVMGYYRGRGKRAKFGMGAFLVGVRGGENFLTIAKIGTGLTDEQWKELKIKTEKLKITSQPKEYGVHKNLIPDAWVIPAMVVEIAADNVTRSPVHSAGLALRFPRLVRFRDDKAVGQITTLDEVKAIG